MISNNVTAIVIAFVLIATGQTVRAAECSFDETCSPLRDCGEEYKHFLNADMNELRKLRVCGIERGTDKHCCKLERRVTPSRVLVSETSLTAHKNIGLINHKKCGKTAKDKIRNGSVAPVGTYPWMALLRYKSTHDGSFAFKCGGSLIADRFVLTAAHCINYVIKHELFSVRLGEHTLSTDLDCDRPSDPKTCNTDAPAWQEIEVEKATPHTEFDYDKKINDIALVKLRREVDFVDIKNIQTICLPINEDQKIDNILDEEGKTIVMTITGWGTDDTRSSSDKLLEAHIPYVPFEQCSKIFDELGTQRPLYKLKIQESYLCAGGDPNKTDTCTGDSGGPISYPARNQKGKYRVFQHGIVAFGAPCFDESLVIPGIYTRVNSFMKWILDNLE